MTPSAGCPTCWSLVRPPIRARTPVSPDGPRSVPPRGAARSGLSQVALCGVAGDRRQDVRVSAGVEGGDLLVDVVVRARVLGPLGGGDRARGAQPPIVPPDQEDAGAADQRPVVGIDPDEVGATADLLVDPLERIR